MLRNKTTDPPIHEQEKSRQYTFSDIFTDRDISYPGTNRPCACRYDLGRPLKGGASTLYDTAYFDPAEHFPDLRGIAKSELHRSQHQQKVVGPLAEKLCALVPVEYDRRSFCSRIVRQDLRNDDCRTIRNFLLAAGTKSQNRKKAQYAMSLIAPFNIYK